MTKYLQTHLVGIQPTGDGEQVVLTAVDHTGSMSIILVWSVETLETLVEKGKGVIVESYRRQSEARIREREASTGEPGVPEEGEGEG